MHCTSYILVYSNPQLEEERNELKRQLNQEKAARAIQEDMVNEHRRAQELLQEVSVKNSLM